jgi:hypothetical protein
MCEHQSTWSNGWDLLQHNVSSKENEKYFLVETI